MLRLKILASVVPLAIAALFARGEFLTGPRPCIEIAGTSVQIAALSWQAHRHVSFTNDPSRATVRVQISDSAEAADFTVIDDIDTAEAGACESNAPPQLVAISRNPSALRSRDLSFAGRTGRLPDLRVLEELFAARCRRPDRRRPRRAPPRRSGVALTLHSPCSHRGRQPRLTSSTLQCRRRIVCPRQTATRRLGSTAISGSLAMGRTFRIKLRFRRFGRRHPWLTFTLRSFMIFSVVFGGAYGFIAGSRSENSGYDPHAFAIGVSFPVCDRLRRARHFERPAPPDAQEDAQDRPAQ